MRHELARRRALLTAALGLVRLRWRGPTPPSVVMLAHWLNSWPGVGAVGTVLLGFALFGEPADAPRLICIGLIVAGIVGLKLVSPH